MPANVVEFIIKGKDDSSGAIRSFTRGVAGASKVVLKMGAAGTAAGISITGFTKSVADSQDFLGKFSQRINANIEAMSGLDFAARRSGLSTQTLTMAMQRMTRRVAEATQGAGELAPALVELGLDAKELSGLSPDEMLLKFSDALSNVDNETDKVRLAFKAFDSEGVALLQMIGQGSGEIEKLTARAKELGITFDATAAANSAKFNDSLSDLWASIRGVSQTVANGFMPILTEAFTNLSNIISENRATIAEFSNSFVSGLAKISAVAIAVFNKVSETISKAFSGEITFKQFIDFAIDTFTSVFNLAADLFSSLIPVAINSFKILWTSFRTIGAWAFDTAYDLFINNTEALLASIGGHFVAFWEAVVEGGNIAFNNIKAIFTGDALVGFEEAFNRVGEATKETRDNIDAINQSIQIDTPDFYTLLTEDLPSATEDARKNLVESFEAGSEGIANAASNYVSSMADIMGVTGSEITELQATILDAVTTTSEVAKETASITTEEISLFYDSLMDKFVEVNQKQRDIAVESAEIVFRTTNSLIKGTSNAIAKAIVHGESLAKSMRNVLKSVATQVISMLIEMGIRRAITSAIFGTAAVGEASAQLAAGQATAAVNAYSSTAAIPVVGPALAPAAAAQANATTGAMAAAGLASVAAAAAVLGQRHAGGTIPQDGSYNLQRGEVVIPTNPNTEIREALADSEGVTGGITIGSMHILENANSLEALAQADSEDVMVMVEEKILVALDELAEKGIKQKAFERGG